MQSEEKIEYLDVEQVRPDPNQPRQTWTEEDREEIQRMVESLKAHGVIDPIEIDENNVIILGERRWRACKIARTKVPVRRKLNLPLAERFERQIIADNQRKDLSPMDRTWAFATAIININTDKNYSVKDVKQMSQMQITNSLFNPKGRGRDGTGIEEFSRRTGISHTTVRDYLQAIDLGRDFWEAVENKRMPITTAREIKRLGDKELEKDLLKTVLKEAKEEQDIPIRKETSEINRIHYCVVNFIGAQKKNTVDKPSASTYLMLSVT